MEEQLLKVTGVIRVGGSTMNMSQIAKIIEELLLQLGQNAKRSGTLLAKRGTNTSEPPRGWGINRRG